MTNLTKHSKIIGGWLVVVRSARSKTGSSIRESRFVPVAGGGQRFREVLEYIEACHLLAVIQWCWQSADLAEAIEPVDHALALPK